MTLRKLRRTALLLTLLQPAAAMAADLTSRTTEKMHTEVSVAGNAASAAAFSLVLFALGALVPLLPFCVLPVALRIDGYSVLSVAALFVLGLATSLFNARSALFSGLRQVTIGSAAAAVTYLVGEAFRALAGVSY